MLLEGVTLEDEVVAVLSKGENPRDYQFIAWKMACMSYNVQDLLKKVEEQNVFHKLGYLAELILHSLRELGMQKESANLAKIVLHHRSPSKVIHLLENYPLPVVDEDKKYMTELNRKWGIISTLTTQDIKDYIVLYES